MTLIRTIRLPNGRITSNLAFGCAGLLRLPTAPRREALLKVAADAGITHFDVARMYGLGTAEGIVGRALAPIRDRVTLGSKFGLPFTPAARGTLGLQSLARWTMRFSPRLKAAANTLLSRRRPSSAPQPKTYGVEAMRASLAMSLRQLGTDRVDLFFLHAPATIDILETDLVDALRERQASGQIGAFGISGYRSELEHFLATRRDVCGEVIQHDFSVFEPGARGKPLTHRLTSVFGVLNGMRPVLSKLLAAERRFAKSWSERLGLDLGRPENAGLVTLALALALNHDGLVIFFTSDAGRLQRIVRQLSEHRFAEQDLLDFREAIVRRLHAD